MAEVIVIGSGTGVPSLRRASPALFMISDRSKVLVDSGPGALRKMLEAGITYQDMDLILYTHTHPDHISDLVAILFACKYADSPRNKDLICYGGPGFKQYFDGIRKIYGSWIDASSYSLTIGETLNQPFLFGGLKILAKPMAHLSTSVGYRIESKDGKSVTFSGDTDYCENLVELGFDADLLVLECSFPDEEKIEGHLTPSLAGRVAREARCKKLLLTHFYPACDGVSIKEQCKQFYNGEVIVAEDLMRVRF